MFILKNINNYLGIRISGITQKKSPRLKQQHQEILNALYYSDSIKDTPKYFSKPHISKLSTISNSLKNNFFPENLLAGIQLTHHDSKVQVYWRHDF